jgi:exosortase/archaeosortase
VSHCVAGVPERVAEGIIPPAISHPVVASGELVRVITNHAFDMKVFYYDSLAIADQLITKFMQKILP